MKKTNPNQKSNRSILCMTYFIVGIFVCLIVYLGYFMQFERESVINNPYNGRISLFSDKVVRGKILAADGTVLADTGEDEFGD